MRYLGLLFTAFLMVADVRAQEADADNNITAVYGTACENYRLEETKSSLLVRTADKASFDAVSQISHFSEIKNDMGDHDFRVTVYKVVDEMIDDLNIRTTKQDKEGLCVEIAGYIRNENLVAAINDALAGKKEREEKKWEEIEAAPPAGEESREEMPEITEEKPLLSEPSENQDSRKALVYIAPTEFFNNTKSAKHAQYLKEQFAGDDYFYTTDEENLADYTVASKVLKAKVDPVNSTTNRLQMVVSLEVASKDKVLSVTEHQNRFVLFDEKDDEQEVAANLMKNLFETAGEQIIRRIEQAERKKGANGTVRKVIAPQAGSF